MLLENNTFNPGKTVVIT